METIRECALLYKNLLNKKYMFTLEGGISFVLEFSPLNFYHLLGLEKLTDIEHLRSSSPKKVYKDICSGRITDKTLHSSKRYYYIENRIKYFENLPDLLSYEKGNKLIVDFDKSKLSFNSKLDYTNYILFKNCETKYVLLTIGYKKSLYPESFFVTDGGEYLSEQVMYDILSIDIIDKQKKIK